MGCDNDRPQRMQLSSSAEIITEQSTPSIGYREGRVEMEPGVPSVFAVNVLAPYILTALIERPKRLIYVSSGMHRSVHPRVDDLLWTKRSWNGSSAYAESKLCDVLLAFAI